MRSAEALLRRLRCERGMTIVELAIAMLICMVGLLATLVVLDRSREVNVTAEARQTAAHVAEGALERILLSAPEFDTLAHAQLPAAGAAGTPAQFVTGANYTFDQDATPRSEPLQVAPGPAPAPLGVVAHDPTDWIDKTGQSRLRGQVYRFITRPDNNTRRVTVVVTTRAPAGVPPILISTLVTRPAA
jgi:type II secretory pathway pseudopilin PulG